MKDLGFLKVERWDKEKEKIYNKKIEGLKKEKNMNGDKITDILQDKLTKDFKIAKERNYKAENNAPFDLVIGDEDCLGMIGFEIKGDTDNFSRLKNQINEYVYAFDGMYLVLHKKQKPEWMPDFIGILRVFEDEEVYIEDYSDIWDFLDIGSNYDWDAILKSNNLGKCANRVKEVLGIIKSIRKNIMFNRFFAIQDGHNTYKYEKFVPLTEKQKSIIIGFDVPYHMKLLKKDILECESKLKNIKEIVSLGQRELKLKLEGK